MRTVSSCVSDKEYAAIVEFANQYGETMSSAIKKAIFGVAARTEEDELSGLQLKLEEPEGEDEYGNALGDVLFSDNIDKVREIAGLPELDLFGYKRKRSEGKPSDVKESNKQSKVTLESYANYLRKKEGKPSGVRPLEELDPVKDRKEFIGRMDDIIEHKFHDEDMGTDKVIQFFDLYGKYRNSS
ncbi:MAG: hypothetical protein EX285_06560 [Thaumarchaeota archaeon]|nr:hypothetical protein [Nitrososphaerota archaeon]